MNTELPALSFRARTILGIALIEALMLLVLVWLSLDYLEKSNRSEMVERTNVLAAEFAFLAKDAVLATDLASLQSFVDNLAESPGVVYVAVRDEQRVLAERGAEEAVPDLGDGPAGSLVGDRYYTRAPISVGDTVFGYVDMGASLSRLQVLLADARRNFVLIAAVEIVLVALFSLMLGTLLTRRLAELRDAARAIAAGGPGATVSVRGRDELAETAAAFNAMSTQLAQNESELRNARDAAEQANREKSRFLAYMSHELRTPLNALLGSLDIVLDGHLTSDQRGFANVARDSGSVLLNIIEDVLDLSRIESGKLALKPEPTAVGTVLETVAGIVRPLAEAKGLRLEIAADDATAQWVQADAPRLCQVLVNLASNAVKFTDEGTVTLRTHASNVAEGQCTLNFEVADTGQGIAPDKQASLFEDFSQAGDSTGRRGGGLGLGLAIAQRIISTMGSNISVESVPLVGSTFRFSLQLPLAEPPLAPQTAAPDAPRASERESGTALPLLVVEDQPANQMVMTAMLQKAGFDVRVAGNGEEALEAVARERFGVILMDINMPVMDGLEATRRIRRLRSAAANTPVIALTANAITEDRESCLAAGMDSFITKPIRAEKLIAEIRRWYRAEQSAPVPQPAAPAATAAGPNRVN